MHPQVFATSIWDFRHDEGFIGQLVQIVSGVILWSLFGYVLLKVLLISYESGKGADEKREIEREKDESPSRMGWYRTVFCLRNSVSVAFLIEGLRYGGGWPTLLLICLAGGCWYGLSPEREWMKHSR